MPYLPGLHDQPVVGCVCVCICAITCWAARSASGWVCGCVCVCPCHTLLGGTISQWLGVCVCVCVSVPYLAGLHDQPVVGCVCVCVYPCHTLLGCTISQWLGVCVCVYPCHTLLGCTISQWLGVCVCVCVSVPYLAGPYDQPVVRFTREVALVLDRSVVLSDGRAQLHPEPDPLRELHRTDVPDHSYKHEIVL